MAIRVEPMHRTAGTSGLKKIVGNAVALHPQRPIVVETYNVPRSDSPAYAPDSETRLRFTDYTANEVVADQLVVLGAHTMRFSPDGERLLFLPGGKGAWSRIIVFAAPWGRE